MHESGLLRWGFATTAMCALLVACGEEEKANDGHATGGSGAATQSGGNGAATDSGGTTTGGASAGGTAGIGGKQWQLLPPSELGLPSDAVFETVVDVVADRERGKYFIVGNATPRQSGDPMGFVLEQTESGWMRHDVPRALVEDTGAEAQRAELFRGWAADGVLHAAGTAAFYAAGIFRLANGTWTRTYGDLPGSTLVGGPLLAIAGSTTDIFAADILGLVLKSTQHGWQLFAERSTNHVEDLWVTGNGTLYAVGSATLLRLQATTWVTVAQLEQGAELMALWGDEQGPLIAVGKRGLVYRRDGDQWTIDAAPTTEDLLDVWGASTSDIYAVGRAGTLLHFDGRSWHSVSVPTQVHLVNIAGLSAGDILVIGTPPATVLAFR